MDSKSKKVVAEIALKLLAFCASDDYASSIWDFIKDEVINDVEESSGYHDEGYFNEDDIRLAIGRGMLECIQYWSDCEE